MLGGLQLGPPPHKKKRKQGREGGGEKKKGKKILPKSAWTNFWPPGLNNTMFMKELSSKTSCFVVVMVITCVLNGECAAPKICPALRNRDNQPPRSLYNINLPIGWIISLFMVLTEGSQQTAITSKTVFVTVTEFLLKSIFDNFGFLLLLATKSMVLWLVGSTLL